jgi:hypothetical protein
MSADDAKRPPERSHEQRLQALRQANEIRLARAQLKRELAAGSIQLAQVLRCPPAFIATAKALELLLMLPRIGPVRAQRVLTGCKIAKTKTIGGLSERQRGALISLLGE